MFPDDFILVIIFGIFMFFSVMCIGYTLVDNLKNRKEKE